MYQFFVEDEQVQQDRICIVGGDVNHIGHVLRMKTGEKIRISDQSGRSYFCRILEITEEEVWAQIEDTDEMGTEFSHKVYLFQGLPKSDKMELIIQKTVELGVYTVIPVAMKNCVVKLDEKKAQSKCKRWQAIAESAAKQSKRTVIPQIQMPLSWKQLGRQRSWTLSWFRMRMKEAWKQQERSFARFRKGVHRSNDRSGGRIFPGRDCAAG